MDGPPFLINPKQERGVWRGLGQKGPGHVPDLIRAFNVPGKEDHAANPAGRDQVQKICRRGESFKSDPEKLTGMPGT